MHSNDITSGGYLFAVIIFAIPGEPVGFGHFFPIHQGLYQLTFGIVNRNSYQAFLGEIEGDAYAGIEGIGKWAIERGDQRHLVILFIGSKLQGDGAKMLDAAIQVAALKPVIINAVAGDFFIQIAVMSQV